MRIIIFSVLLVFIVTFPSLLAYILKIDKYSALYLSLPITIILTYIVTSKFLFNTTKTLMKIAEKHAKQIDKLSQQLIELRNEVKLEFATFYAIVSNGKNSHLSIDETIVKDTLEYIKGFDDINFDDFRKKYADTVLTVDEAIEMSNNIKALMESSNRLLDETLQAAKIAEDYVKQAEDSTKLNEVVKRFFH